MYMMNKPAKCANISPSSLFTTSRHPSIFQPLQESILPAAIPEL
jgi:hypothetical protein